MNTYAKYLRFVSSFASERDGLFLVYQYDDDDGPENLICRVTPGMTLAQVFSKIDDWEDR